MDNGQDTINEEAIGWFVLLRDDGATDSDRARFDAWLNADRRHRDAWLDIENIWAGIDQVADSNVEQASIPAGHHAEIAGASRFRRRLPHHWRMAAAAVLLIAATLAGYWSVQPPGFASALFADFRTEPGETRVVTLPDGSRVTLGAASAISVEFDTISRQVVLHRGQAFYKVTPDSGRPFTVTAGEVQATVVGTAFDVDIVDGRTTVAVAEGVVAVSMGKSNTAPVRLEAGKAIRYGADGPSAVFAFDASDIGTWRTGRMVFRAAPLSTVLGNLERYLGGRILVTDSAIASLPVTGAFDTRRPDAALDTIARTLPVRLTRLTDFLILIHSAE